MSVEGIETDHRIEAIFNGYALYGYDIPAIFRANFEHIQAGIEQCSLRDMLFLSAKMGKRSV